MVVEVRNRDSLNKRIAILRMDREVGEGWVNCEGSNDEDL